MNLFALKYLFLLILEGEMTSKEMAHRLGEEPYNASHAMGILRKIGLVKHPDNRIRSWMAETRNTTVLSMEKLLLVSKNSLGIKNLLSIPSVVRASNNFYKRKKGATISGLMKSTGLSKVSVMKALKKMTSLSLLNKTIGKPNRYYPCDALLSQLFFKTSHDIAYLFTSRKDRALSTKNVINKIKNNQSVLILIHYGSSAKGTVDKLSDVDLFVVSQDRISRGEILSRYSHHGIDLAVYSKTGFLDFLEKQPDFIAHIATAKVLKGKDILEALVQ